MRITISVLCIAVLLTTAGCSSKAPKGAGGLAEHDYSYIDDEENSATPSHPVGLENALYFEQQLSQRHFDALLLAGANICFPASVKTAKIRQARIARQLQGGLKGDAANDLIIQRDQLTRLERRLNYVQMQDSCMPTQSYQGDTPGNFANNAPAPSVQDKQMTTMSNAQLQHLTSLLNNNNQFVINSSELNPRYVGQLSEAAQLLRTHPQYHLKLTGHSDSAGQQANNLKLSLARASKVERYLLIFGISPNNIQVTGTGSSQPFFSDADLDNTDNDQALARLINRRVSIELINVNNSTEVTPK